LPLKQHGISFVSLKYHSLKDGKLLMQKSPRQLSLIISALGVVYGDIGTSPLYAFRLCFRGGAHIGVSYQTVLGILSLIIWSMVIVVSLKYLLIVLRADNNGEGGVLALMTLARKKVNPREKLYRRLIGFGLIGAAFLYGDSLITPSISVMSAIEGLILVTPVMNDLVVPLSIAILALLFMFQHYGTEKVGSSFGPVMIVWFLVIGILGLSAIVANPVIFNAFNPAFAVRFFIDEPVKAFITLGSSFLALTGAEALYADLGHFGKKSIRAGWFYIVFPCLLLNYLGQGAALLSNPSFIDQPFFHLAPSWAIIPLSVLATCATIIASQAVISAAFSLTLQATQLGFMPRPQIIHTSPLIHGQIFVPFINTVLFVGTVILVAVFRHSENLAGAYGVAISTTMLITTIMIFTVMARNWGLGRSKSYFYLFPFFIVDILFFCANLLKVPAGGWIPIAFGAVLYLIITTWDRGQKIVRSRLGANAVTEREFLEEVSEMELCRVKGTAVFLSARPTDIPSVLFLNFLHNHVLHDTTIILTVMNREIPYVDENERLQITAISKGIYRLMLYYGFMERPNISRDLQKVVLDNKAINPVDVTFFLSRLRMTIRKGPSMPEWRKSIYSFLVKNATEASDYFRLPPDRVVEINLIVEL
jgi:KUP system potassium uptake protein